MNAAILAFVNLLAVLLCAALLAHASAQLHLRQRGFGLVVFALVLWGLAWLVPQAVSAFVFDSPRLLLRLWFGNWLISAFSAVLLLRTLAQIPRPLGDVARLDGLSGPAIFWNVVFPYAKQILLVIAVLTLMATSIELLRPLLDSKITEQPLAVPGNLNVRTAAGIGLVAAASVVLAIPAVVIALLVRRPIEAVGASEIETA